MGKRAILIFCACLFSLAAVIAQQPNPANAKVATVTYSKAAKQAEQGKLVPLAWYYLEDKGVYLCAITPSNFMLQGYYFDEAINEVDLIQYDFKNAHIQQRCDARGNCVGAAYGVIKAGILEVDPITVFKWGDDLVQDNIVSNAVFDLRGMQGNNYGIVSNTITKHAVVTLSNADSLYFIKNTCTNSTIWSAKGTTGHIYDNNFSAEISVFMDSANITVSDNSLSGADKTFDISGGQGRFGGNKGVGNIYCRQCGPNATVLSANLFDGASIFADSMNAHINAVELHRGSELHMAGSDSAFSKAYLDFTAIVHVDGNNNRSEYNRFIGCRDGYGTHFFVKMSKWGFLGNCSFSSCKTVMLDSTMQYNMQTLDDKNIGINATPTNGFQVKGNVFLDLENESIRILHLRKFANDEEAIKGGLSPYSLYINSDNGAICIVRSIVDP